MKKTMLLAAVLACTALVVWLLVRTDARPGSGTDDPRRPDERETARAGGDRPRVEDVLHRESASAAEAGSPTATATLPAITILVRWSDDDTPAVGIGLSIVAPAGLDADLATLDRTTDDQGSCVMTDLPPGRIEIRTDRGTTHTVELSPATNPNVTLRLPRGTRVHGAVVDEGGSPVPYASIWLSSDEWPGRGHVVAHAGADGSFELLGVIERRYVAALARGHAPSHCLPIDGATKAALRLELSGASAAVVGRVLDPHDRAVARVAVIADYADRVPGPDGTPIDGFPDPRVLTDSSGHFEMDDLPSGPLSLILRAAGHAPSLHRFDLAPGQRLDVDLKLVPGVQVSGVVTDDHDQPLGGVEVVARGVAEFDYATLRTSSEGRFAFPSLCAGAIEIRATAIGYRTASVSLFAQPGTSLEQQLVMVARHGIHGMLEDVTGRAVPGWRLLWESDVAPGGDLVKATTDAEGRFACALLPGETYHVAVHGEAPPWLPLTTMVMGAKDAEQNLRLPFAAGAKSSVRGELIADGPSPPRVERVELIAREQGRPVVATMPSDAAPGVFASAEVPPGDYQLGLRLHDDGDSLVILGRYRLAPDVPLDLGRIPITTLGRVRTTVVGAGGEPLQGLEIRLQGTRTLELADHGPELSLWLPPGDYSLLVAAAEHVTSGWIPVHIDAGAVRRPEIRLESGRRCNLVFPVPAPKGWDDVQRARVHFADQLGHVLLDHTYEVVRGRPMQFRPVLADKPYVLTLTTGDGRMFEGRFRGPAAGAPDVPVEIEVSPRQ
ncbi:MAG: carboxypeptidase-like regulatory domain-containing protein [Planctomycetota bacterium]